MAQTPGALYFSHMRDGPLIRIRLPGGRVRADQLRVIAALAQSFGSGRIDLTNLANLQVRGLRRVKPAALKAALGGAGLLPHVAWADRLRNIQGDPLAGLAGGELMDTGPVIDALDKALQGAPVLKACYNKFSYVVDGGGRSNIAALPHDVALVAQKGARDVRFRLYLAGRATPFCAAPDHAPAMAVAAAKMALSFPDRKDTPLMAFVKRTAYRPQSGGAGVLARGALALAGAQENRIRRLIRHIPLEAMTTRLAGYLDAPFERLDRKPGQKRKLAASIGAVAQKGGDLMLCGFGVPLGRLDAGRLTAIARLADEYGKGELRLSPWHVVFIPHVKAHRAQSLLQEAAALGFIIDETFLHIDVSACSGREGCRGAKLATPDHALAVMQAFAAQGDSRRFAPLSVHVSGCPKGCAHRGRSDILALEREDASGYYIYEHSTALAPQKQSRVEGTISAKDLPRVVRELALKQRAQSEP